MTEFIRTFFVSPDGTFVAGWWATLWKTCCVLGALSFSVGFGIALGLWAGPISTPARLRGKAE